MSMEKKFNFQALRELKELHKLKNQHRKRLLKKAKNLSISKVLRLQRLTLINLGNQLKGLQLKVVGSLSLLHLKLKVSQNQKKMYRTKQQLKNHQKSEKKLKKKEKLLLKKHLMLQNFLIQEQRLIPLKQERLCLPQNLEMLVEAIVQRKLHMDYN